MQIYAHGGSTILTKYNFTLLLIGNNYCKPTVPEKSTHMTPLLWKPFSTDTVLMELASQT